MDSLKWTQKFLTVPPLCKCLTLSQQEHLRSTQTNVLKELASVKRLDIVWDVYLEDSLKAATRQKRGSGLQKKVIPSATLPDNWKGFLRVDDNKTELFAFLAKKVGGTKVEGKQLVTTLLSGILASPPFSDVSSNSLQPCSHEEADTRLFLHVQDCSRSGSRVMIRSTDTDVIVLAVANFRRLPVQEIWIAFGVGKHFRYLPAHKIALQLGRQSSEALPMFHVFSGCDTVSFFAGKGKNKCWETWKSFPEATATFLLLAKGPERI